MEIATMWTHIERYVGVRSSSPVWLYRGNSTEAYSFNALKEKYPNIDFSSNRFYGTFKVGGDSRFIGKKIISGTVNAASAQLIREGSAINRDAYDCIGRMSSALKEYGGSVLNIAAVRAPHYKNLEKAFSDYRVPMSEVLRLKPYQGDTSLAWSYLCYLIARYKYGYRS